jgi:hypothetical protein
VLALTIAALSALYLAHRQRLLSLLHLIADAKQAKRKTRVGQRAMAEETYKNAKWQNDPGDIPQNNLIGH